MIEAATALREMRARGIDNASELLEYADPDKIIGACHWWDARKSRNNVGPGLLAQKIRAGGLDDQETAEFGVRRHGQLRRERFAEFAQRFPIGSVVDSHEEMQARLWADDEGDCDGDMLVTEISYPVLALECDCCGLTVGVPLRSLFAIGRPA
jgi:hypothetical protein